MSHRIDQNNLVHRLVQQKAAMFCATVSIRGSIYRRTESAILDQITSCEEGIACQQVIEIPEFKDELQIFINCGVATCREIEIEQAQGKCLAKFRPASSKRDVTFEMSHKDTGLSDFFLDDGIRFPENALVAYSGWKRFFSLDSLFTIKSNPRINYGEFSASTSYAGQLKVDIEMHPSLYDEVNSSRNNPARGYVICASLVKLLEELHVAYLRVELGEGADVEVQLLEQAEGLKEFLRSREPPIPTWEDENFNATHAASMYRPVPNPVEMEAEE